ncbi:MAG: hypothetical protein WCH57_00065 [Verrucomicrobiota bacterium]
MQTFTSPRLFAMLVLLAMAALGACERKITDANLHAVKPDMTTKEVESILGAPNKIETVSEPPAEAVKTISVTRYIYVQNGKKIELTFVGDRLGTGSKNGTPAITGTIGK